MACGTGRPAGGSGGISIAPTLDTVAAGLALPLPSESLLGPKSLKRIPAVHTIATITTTITGIKSLRMFLSRREVA
jgi:hypothetical protein